MNLILKKNIIIGLSISIAVAVILASLFCTKAKEIEDKIKPLILLSIDGFRYDYIEKYQPPNLLLMIKDGVRAESMMPSYPSKTFPNHITLVTGMYPSNHGIVHNRFYDRELDDVYKMGKAFDEPKWMQGTPLWIHAEKNGVKSASYFWPESDSKIDGITSSYSFTYNKQTPYQQRIDQIVDWLKLPVKERPTLILSYFSLVDSKGHQFGPDSNQVKKAVLEVDGYIGNLRKRIATELDIKVNIVVVSDHGMVNIDGGQKINWALLGEFNGYQVVNGTTQLMLYAKDVTSKEDMAALVNNLNQKSNGHYQAYLKQDLPINLNYTDNDRIADIVIEALSPSIFVGNKQHSEQLSGMHGYDPNLVPEMGALFIANGPSFKNGLTIPAFENIHVFPMLNHLLELPMPANIDGKLKILAPILKQNIK